ALWIYAHEPFEQMQVSGGNHAHHATLREYGQVAHALLPHQPVRLCHEFVLLDALRVGTHELADRKGGVDQDELLWVGSVRARRRECIARSRGASLTPASRLTGLADMERTLVVGAHQLGHLSARHQ